MTEGLTDLTVGLLLGGLGVSACWGLFWLAISLTGVSRRTCSGAVVQKSVLAGLLPLVLMAALIWWYEGRHGFTPALGAGLLAMPIVLVGFALRQGPDGQRAGIHMVEGVRHLMHELLGKHHGCGGCDHEEGRGGCE